MKTKELIRKLQEADPSGEIECCVGNVDIHFVSREPAYWDGPLQVLTRDETNTKDYNIVGGQYIRSGYKIQIHTLEISDIFDDPNVVINYSMVGEAALIEKYKESDEKSRKKYKEIYLRLEKDLFVRWARKVAATIAGDITKVDRCAALFFDSSLSRNDPLPTEKTEAEKRGECVYDSYNNRRQLQWSNEITVEFDGIDWKFSKKKALK